MPLPEDRGWVPVSNSKLYVGGSSKLAYANKSFTDGDMQGLNDLFPSGIVTLEFDTIEFSGLNTDFSSLPVLGSAATITTLTCKDSTNMSGVIPATWAACTLLKTIDVSGNGWTEDEVDDFLNALWVAVQAGMTSGATSPVIDISGNTAPTAASAAAIAGLEGDTPAWTVTTD